MAKAATKHKVVKSAEWLSARKDLLKKEKEFSRLRDKLSKQRRNLPWEKVDKDYLFQGAKGKESLADLFGDKSQLIVYHFMLGPDWKEGCPGCSFLADHFDGAIPHLAAKDVQFVVVSRAPLKEIKAFQKRMGWNFKWISSNGSDFNYDYHVSMKQDPKSEKTVYNYKKQDYFGEEGPGASAFYMDKAGNIFHTYSTYARGLDMFLGAYNWLEITPKGRDEEKEYPMSWVRHHDKY